MKIIVSASGLVYIIVPSTKLKSLFEKDQEGDYLYNGIFRTAKGAYDLQ
jgi:hypothetical protein